MLQLIRGNVGSWFIKILFGFLILSFAVWGIGDLFRGGGVRATVATVGDERITVSSLTRAFQAELGRLQQIFGPQLDVQLALSLGMLDTAMDRLVDEALFSQAAGGLGVQAPDEIIAASVQQEPMFQGSTGAFDRFQFDQFLRATNQDEPGFMASRRRELARRELVAAIGAGVTVPGTLADALHRYRNETRHIKAILIGPDTVGDIAAPSEEQIGAYYRDNEQIFMAPEYRVLRVVSLTPSILTEGIEIPDDVLRAEYENRLDQYGSSEQRAFEQIVAADREVAARIAEAASGGLSLAEAVDSVDAADGSSVSVIPLELAPRAEFLPVLAEAGFGLPAGGTSAPVESPFGWHVLQLTEIVQGGTRSYESVRSELEDELKLGEAIDEMYVVVNEFDDLLSSDVDLSDAAARLNLPVIVTGPVARDGSLRDGGVLEGVPSLPEVLADGFSLFEGVTGTVESTQQEGFFVVRVEQVIEPALRPLDTVRDTVIAGWTAQQTTAAIEVLAEATAERVDAGGEIAEIAAELGAAVFEQADLRRDGANSGTLPEELVTSVFQAALGDVALAPTQSGYAVARLEAVIPAPAADAAAREDIATGQTQAILGDLLAGFSQSLRSEYTVDIDRDSMSQLFQQHEPQ